MGAKYLPTTNDLKASRRFLQRQRPLPKFQKSTAGPTAGKARKR